MIPKEKAAELVGKHRELVKSITVGNYGIQSKNDTAKHHALISVEEIIVTLDLMELSERGMIVGGYGQDFWNKVKDEIKAL